MKIVKHNQGSDAWKAWRREGIGGSDAATILGVSPFEDATIANLMREKVEGWERETNFAMRRGTRFEPTARTLYEIHARCVAPPVCVEHDEFPWARVSLDGLCQLTHRDSQPWILELKVPHWQAHSSALAGVVPGYYMPQCQWQMWVCGLDRLDYVSYSAAERFATADRLAVVPVEVDAELQGRLVVECAAFWFQVCEERAKRRQSVGV